MKHHEIIPTGTAGCDYTGGGIWIAYIPVLIDGKKAAIIYDNEAYEYDDKDIVEFTVYNYEDEYGDSLNEQLTDYFDSGVYTEKKKKSPYKKLFKKLRKSIKKALETQHPFDSVPLEKKNKIKPYWEKR